MSETDPPTPPPGVFRGRHLSPSADPFSFNTWDDVEWTEERQQAIDEAIAKQLAQAAPDTGAVARVMSDAGSRWDHFYKNHNRWFFKDRQWLSSEFPELFSEGVRVVWEVGCGAGNTLFPLFKHHALVNQRPITVHACDVSEEAVNLVKSFREYKPDYMNVFVFDANTGTLPESIGEGTVDAITSIFVLSALDPANLPSVFAAFWRALRPGGILLIRDYAWGDLAQTRLRPERVVSPDGSLYTRGDGTAVHFFRASEFDELAGNFGFRVTQNYTDRRLIVNRKRRLEMFRSWIQVKMIKPE
jgi:tRNAThr (cytosine32-N3)-methyltransferase